MTLSQIQAATGLKGIRQVSDTTVVVEYANGNCSPATEAEKRMWRVLLRLSEEG